MRKLCFLFISVFFFQNYLVAQNYQTVQSGTEYYLADLASGNIKAIKIASATSNGTDSILTNFFVARDTGDYCIWVTAPSWVGKEIIIRNNGLNIFFNTNNDSIFINMLADLNETWTLYTFPNDDYIEAEIISYDTATIISVLDSVKTILLQAKDSGGNNISHSVNGRQIKISKNYGFVQLPEFYEFPVNSSIDYKRINAHRLTNGDVYNFDVDDKFYYEYTYNGGSSPPDYNVQRVLTKSYSANSDTVFYDIEFTFINNEVEWNPQPHMVTTVSVDTSSSYFTNLDSLLNYDIMPEESLVDTFQGVYSYGMSYFFCENRIKESFNSVATIWYDNNNGCFTNFSLLSSQVYFSYAEGLGRVSDHWYDDGNGSSGTLDMYGYIKGNHTCGSDFVTGIENIEKSEEIIFPNPTHDIANIRTEKEDSYALEFFNNLGQTLLEKEFKGKSQVVNVSQLPVGLYFISLTDSEGQKQIYKLIKE